MAQEALNIHGHLAFPGGKAEQLPRKVPIGQPGKVPDGGIHIGQLLPQKRVTAPKGAAKPALFVGGEVAVFDGCRLLAFCEKNFGIQAFEHAKPIHLIGIELGEYRRPAAGVGRRESAGDHRAADFTPLLPRMVDVAVQRKRADDDDVKLLLHKKAPCPVWLRKAYPTRSTHACAI